MIKLIKMESDQYSKACHLCSFYEGSPKCDGWKSYCERGTKGYVHEEDPEYTDDNPLDTQVGGGHYKDMKIQPVEFNQMNQLNYCEANVVKYICRHASKNGLEDLRKAIHYIELLIQMEYPDENQ